MSDSELVQKLIDAGRILQAEGHADLTRGHVSARLPDNPEHFIMKPHSFGFDEITPENVVTCDLSGKKLSGANRHSEVFIHSEIFKLRPDIGSVIHSHSPYAVAFSSTEQPMEVLSQPGALFSDELPRFTATIDLIRLPEQGRDLAIALGEHKAVLLQGHGVAVCGASIEEAVIRALMLENACMIQLAAKAAGPTHSPYSKDDVRRLKDKLSSPEQFAINFNYLRRKHGQRR